MGFMSRTTGFILFAGLATVVLVCAASTSAQDPDPGETIMLKSCQGCHDLRVIQTTALDPDGWTKLINDMIERNGAVVSKEDMPVLVKYLTLHHGPVPDGPGKDILLNTCTMCHDLGRIKTGRRTAEEWEETLISMLNEGAPLSDAQFPVIHRYLSRNFNIE
jgi:cytochrome c5